MAVASEERWEAELSNRYSDSEDEDTQAGNGKGQSDSDDDEAAEERLEQCAR